MATSSISVVFTQSGAAGVARSIRDIARAAEQADSATNFLKRALLSFGGVIAVHDMLAMADSATTLRNRLAFVTTGTTAATQAFDRLVNVARDTRTGLDAVGELYQRMANSTRGLGYSQAQLIEVTKGVVQATRLSGSSAEEAERAVRQLAQGLALGALKGQDFRSVIQQAPGIIQVLADHLKISTGAVKQLGEESKLTSKVIVDSFLAQSGKLNENFGKYIPTFSEQLTILRVELTLFFDTLLNKSVVGATITRMLKAFTDGVRSATKMLEDFNGVSEDTSRILAAVGVAIAGVAILTAAEHFVKFANGVALSNSALKRMPALILAIGAAYAGLSIGDEANKGNAPVDKAVRGTVQKGLLDIQALGSLESAAISGFFGNKEKEKKLLEEYMKLSTAGESVLKGGPEGFTETDKNSLKNISQKSTVQRITEEINNIQRQMKSLLGDDSNVEQTLPGLATPEQSKKALDQILDALDQERTSLQMTSRERETSNKLYQINLQLKKVGLDITTAENDAVYAFIDMKVRENQKLREEAAVRQEVTGALEDNARKLKIIEEQMKTASGPQLHAYTQAWLDLKIAMEESSGTLTGGLQAGFLEVGKTISNWSTMAKQTVTDAFSGMEDAFVEFVKTGKLSFQSLIDTMISDLSRLLFRKALFGLLGATGLADFFKAPGLAVGGPVSAGRPYVVGEEGPELFVPSSSGRIVPNGMSLGATPVNVNVVNVTDPNEVTRHLNSTSGQDTILNVLRKNRNAARQAIGV